MNTDVKELYDAAVAVRENAHCSLSGYKVGVALRGSDGNIYVGCNVESIAYTNSTHAETNAIDTIVANGVKEITHLIVVTDSNPAGFPCALCRQKIIEFGKDAVVIAANPAGEIRTSTIQELYPEPFISL